MSNIHVTVGGVPTTKIPRTPFLAMAIPSRGSEFPILVLSESMRGDDGQRRFNAYRIDGETVTKAKNTYNKRYFSISEQYMVPLRRGESIVLTQGE